MTTAARTTATAATRASTEPPPPSEPSALVLRVSVGFGGAKGQSHVAAPPTALRGLRASVPRADAPCHLGRVNPELRTTPFPAGRAPRPRGTGARIGCPS